MLTLFLNLASHSGTPGEGACIACVGEKKTEAIRFIDHRIGDEQLIPELDIALKEAGWEMRVTLSTVEESTRSNVINRVACVTGPGGFTSLRMGVTLANVLADQLQVPIAGVRLDEVYAARAAACHPEEESRSAGRRLEGRHAASVMVRDGLRPPHHDTFASSFLWLHSTKRTQLFVRGFGEFEKQFPEATLMEMEELFSILKTVNCKLKTPSFPWTGELLPVHEEMITKAGGRKLPLAPLAEVLPHFLAGLTYERKQLEPWYGRKW